MMSFRMVIKDMFIFVPVSIYIHRTRPSSIYFDELGLFFTYFGIFYEYIILKQRKLYSVNVNGGNSV